MSVETRQKIPVPRRSFLWSLNETSGEILTHVGPTEFTPSANDRIVKSNGRGGYEQARMEACPFVVARDGEYVLLQNPVTHKDEDGGANGSYVPGGNKEKSLEMGTTRVIPGPCAFPLWPGQSAEVRNAHKLGANHYLLVEVVSDVDEQAPYYELVRRSAEQASVVIEADAGDDEEDATPEAERRRLVIGQRIVIQGRHTQLFIPPTGIEVVPAIEERADEGDGVANLPGPQADELISLLQQVESGLTVRQFSVLKNELRHRTEIQSAHRAIMLTALDDAWNTRGAARKSRGGPATEQLDPYARKAVVLGPKNYCILFDADGNPRIVRGPARVFPGPHDRFLHRGSRRRVYDAYELSENQALWLRIITPISREELAKRLPAGFALELDRYPAGHELLVRGRPSVFFPFIEAEIINPRTGEPHVGNDHDEVVVDAIGIDQKSGIYVRDLRTGMVKMVRGETTYLVDPRHEAHVQRRVPADHWNLWIAHGETQKRVEKDVLTPWALSVIVPNNEAILITSRHGRRVVVGPRTELLEYEEQLTPLRLAKGVSKDGHQSVTTCFLRVQGGRLADNFEVESADYVRLKVRLGVAGHFEGEPEAWFSVEDPVKLLADVLRARLRRGARKHPATKLLASFPDVVEETLFGEDGKLSFPENGMTIDAVDVLSCQIADAELARAFADVQREAVALQLKDEQAARRLVSSRLKDALDAEESTLQQRAHGRLAETQRLELEDEHGIEQRRIELTATRAELEQARRHEAQTRDGDFDRTQKSATAELQAKLRQLSAEAEARAAEIVGTVRLSQAETEAEVIRKTAMTQAEADAVRLRAIEKELVGALQSAADSEVMKAAAQNMNLVALLGGRTPAELFGHLLQGTPLQRTVEGMKGRSGEPS
ncbi:MAG: hypothetical protein H6706_09505 [Myxococcales bacterium]|nr:hypothetical protein [Myxococcales bacterium]